MTSQVLPTVTFKHLVAGSVFHYQKRKAHKDADNEPVETLTFHGKKGGVGFYSTNDTDKIEQLTKLSQNPQVQIERIDVELTEALDAPEASILHKPVDPAITQATEEVQNDAARNADPKVIAAQEALAGLLRQQAGS